MTPLGQATTFSPEVSAALFRRVERAASQSDVRAAVEANHDENRWWPTSVEDWRLRMAVAGWSTRISYRMIRTYSQVVAEVDEVGYERLREHSDEEMAALVAPLGLINTRLSYFRSLCEFLDGLAAEDVDPLATDADEFIARFAEEVSHASFKVAQCAALYSRGYHCGVIPVDSGMVSRLAPLLGMSFRPGAIAHDDMRQVLQACVTDRESDYRALAQTLGYRVAIPDGTPPSWWVHLVLIYFKRLYCNGPNDRLCRQRPGCDALVDCTCGNKSLKRG